MLKVFRELIQITDDDIKIIAYAILIGCSIGTIVGIALDNIPLFFSLGGVIGIVVSIIISIKGKLTNIYNKK